MAKRGDIAREHVKDTIVGAFGEDFVTIQDKKIYVVADDGNGEKIQFAITMTMPKTPVGAANAVPATAAPAASRPSGNSAPWEMSAETPAPAPVATEVSAEDKAKVDELMKILGII